MWRAGGKAAARAPGIGAVIPESAILTDPHYLLTRERANVPYLNVTSRVPQRSIRGAHPPPAHYMNRRKSVNTSMPTTIVPSMVRRHKSHANPASVA